jgi:hypothetical protein
MLEKFVTTLGTGFPAAPYVVGVDLWLRASEGDSVASELKSQLLKRDHACVSSLMAFRYELAATTALQIHWLHLFLQRASHVPDPPYHPRLVQQLDVDVAVALAAACHFPLVLFCEPNHAALRLMKSLEVSHFLVGAHL